MTENFFLLSFLWGVGWSYVFSLPPGIINLSVLDTTAHKGLKYGIILACAACIIEFIQSFIGTKFSAWFMAHENIKVYIKIAIIPVFVIMSINYYRKAYRTYRDQKLNIDRTKKGKRVGSFGKGLLVGVLNPIAIPFFIFLAAKTEEEGLLKDNWPSIFTYVTGTTIGTFLAFLTYGLLSRVIASKLRQFRFWTDLIIASVFVVLSIQQLVMMIVKNEFKF
jgi:threonine/homoserine/homoserine lactone efflux protein